MSNTDAIRTPESLWARALSHLEEAGPGTECRGYSESLPLCSHGTLCRAPQPAQRSARTGFSLVEVVIALLVLVVGLLGILTLFPLGLDSNRDAGDDTHTAQFASRVFNGILGQAVAGTSLWNQIYATALMGCTNALEVSLAPEGGGLWSSQTGLTVNIGTGVYVNTFIVSDDSRIVEHTYRYRLKAYVTDVMRWDNRFPGQGRATWIDWEGWNTEDPPEYVTNRVTYWWVCPIQYGNDQLHYRRKIVRLVLEVYPEYYGNRNSRTFYCYLPKLM